MYKSDYFSKKLITSIHVQKQPPEVFFKKRVLLEISQNLQENTCAEVFFLIKLQVSAPNFIKKETLAQVFFCEFCEIFKNTSFIEHLWATASAYQALLEFRRPPPP